jgi:hypothetical protein
MPILVRLAFPFSKAPKDIKMFHLLKDKRFYGHMGKMSWSDGEDRYDVDVFVVKTQSLIDTVSQDILEKWLRLPIETIKKIPFFSMDPYYLESYSDYDDAIA